MRTTVRLPDELMRAAKLFTQLLEETGAIGNLVSDAWHAALAIEHGCELISDDSDFSRFPGLRWRRPG